MLTFNLTKSSSSAFDASHLPGVSRVEPFRTVPALLRKGAREHRLGLMGLSESPELYRILDEEQMTVTFPPGRGLTITQKLAEILDVRVNDMLTVEVLEADLKPQEIFVSAIFSNYTDPGAYLNRADLHRLMMESERHSGLFLSVDANQLTSLYEAVKETPAIAGVLDNNAARQNFQMLIQENTRIMRLVNSIFGIIIAIGVIYNAALIALADSSRDLATLRVLGFTQRDVSVVLLGEIAAITLIAIPIGLPVGYGFCFLATLAIDTESHRFPLIVSHATYGYAAVVVLLSALAAMVIVRQMLSRLDLVAVLKVKIS